MRLNQETLKHLPMEAKMGFEPSIFDLPEKILQFGTGILLRGLPDYFVDKANKQGIFNGRIVVVKSTTQGEINDFKVQNNLYTIAIRGFENGDSVSENIINASISRVLTAANEWDEILKCADSPEMKIIFSNTTESGIVLLEESIGQNPPVSFPAKLLAFLHRRYQTFNGAKTAAMVIVPTELIANNGDQLKAIVLHLCKFNQLSQDFVDWLKFANIFCNSLVDRIVPGYPKNEILDTLQAQLGYEDKLLITAEPYRLWAIEAPEHVSEILSFCKADKNITIRPDIQEFRELKLRLLNGTHTFCCGLAVLEGFTTVSEAMENDYFAKLIIKLMADEIAPAIPFAIAEEKKTSFSHQVLDRFRNPNIEHQWLSITMNYTSKMKLRNVPLLAHYQNSGEKFPSLMAQCFAAFIRFMKVSRVENGKYYGEIKGKQYLINDAYAEYFQGLWGKSPLISMVKEILQNQALWETNLDLIPEFGAAITQKLAIYLAADSTK